MKSVESVEGIAGNWALPRRLTIATGQLVQIRIRRRAFEAFLRAFEGDLRVNMRRSYSKAMSFGQYGVRRGAQKAQNGLWSF